MKQRPKAFFDMLANTQEVVAKATTCPPGAQNAGRSGSEAAIFSAFQAMTELVWVRLGNQKSCRAL